MMFFSIDSDDMYLFPVLTSVNYERIHCAIKQSNY